MASPHNINHMFHRPVKHGMAIALVLLMLFANAAPVMALPPRPHGLFGYVTSGGVNVPDGTVVTAWCNGVLAGQTATFTFEGQSVYSFDVAGDDLDTPGVIEGCKEGDPIIIKVGGVTVPQASIWHSGSNQQLDLTVPAATPELVTVSPASGSLGATLDVAITGANTHFSQGTSTVSFGAGITVNSVTVGSATQLSANITIAGGAAPGARTVTVTTGGEVVSKVNGFTVLGPNVDIYLPAAATGSVGAAVSIPITTLADLTGKLIHSYQFTVTFNAAVLQPTGVSTASSLSAGWPVSETHATAGEISVVGYGVNPLAGSGKLLDLTFTVVGAGGATSPLTFADFRFNDGNPGDVTHNGQFTVQGLEIAGAVTYAATVSPVSGVTMTLSGAGSGSAVSDATGAYRLPVASIGNYTVTPAKARYSGGAISTYDSAHIAQCILGTRPAADCPLASSDVSDNGDIGAYDAALIARHAVGMMTNPSSSAGQWSFNPASRSYSPLTVGQSGQNYAAFLEGDVTGNWAGGGVSAAQTSVAVCLDGQVAAAGDTLSLPLRVSGAAGEEILAYQFDVRYDPARLSFERVITESTLTAAWSLAVNDEEAGLLRVGGYNADALASDGALLMLRFDALTAIADGQSPSLDGFQFNESQPQAGLVCTAMNSGVYLPLIAR